MLSFLPGFVVHLILAVGILLVLASIFLSMVPFVSKYKMPLNVLGILVVALGTYLSGGLALKKEMDLKVAKLETKLAEAEARAEKKNTEIVTKIVTDTKIIREKGDEIIRYVDREIIKYDDKCEIPTEFVDVLNQAAQIGGKSE
jgi:flagellar motor component MotA